MAKLQTADFPTVWLDPHSAREAVAHSSLPATMRHVLRVIAEMADNKTGKAWPSVQTLAARTGLSARAIKEHTAGAVDAGYLWKVQRFNNSVIYRLAAPADAVVLTGNKAGRRARAIGALHQKDELLEVDDGDLEALNEPDTADAEPRPKPDRPTFPPQVAADLTALSLEELMAYTGKAPSGSPQYKAAVAERIRRISAEAVDAAGAMPG